MENFPGYPVKFRFFNIFLTMCEAFCCQDHGGAGQFCKLMLFLLWFNVQDGENRTPPPRDTASANIKLYTPSTPKYQYYPTVLC